MKHKHLMTGCLMAMTLLFVMPAPASAQFSGLVNKVKQKAKESVENTSQQRDRQNAMDKLKAASAEKNDNSASTTTSFLRVSASSV